MLFIIFWSKWYSRVIGQGISGPENFKKVQTKKLVKWTKSIWRKFFRSDYILALIFGNSFIFFYPLWLLLLTHTHTLFFCFCLHVCLFVYITVHKAENLEGHCGSVRHWSLIQWSLYVEETLWQKFTAIRMLLWSWWHWSRANTCSGTAAQSFCHQIAEVL